MNKKFLQMTLINGLVILSVFIVKMYIDNQNYYNRWVLEVFDVPTIESMTDTNNYKIIAYVGDIPIVDRYEFFVKQTTIPIELKAELDMSAYKILYKYENEWRYFPSAIITPTSFRWSTTHHFVNKADTLSIEQQIKNEYGKYRNPERFNSYVKGLYIDEYKKLISKPNKIEF